MLYGVTDIMRDVRVCIDQNMVSAPLADASDIDTLSLDEIIRAKLLHAVRDVHGQAPAHMLEQGHNLPADVYWADMHCGWVLLPDDFMRLIVFRMSDWERPVYQAISAADPLYALQHSRVKALRGTPQRPVCAIGIRPEGKVLEFFSCRSDNAWVMTGAYIPYPEIDSDGYIDISERCYMAAVYRAASLTLQATGSLDMAKVMDEMSKSTLQ